MSATQANKRKLEEALHPEKKQKTMDASETANKWKISDDHDDVVSTKSSRKAPTNSKKVNTQNILDAFNLLGAVTWLNLTTMKKNHPYIVTKMNRQQTRYGERLMAELNTHSRLYLPERYNGLTDCDLREIGCDKYVLINMGARGMSFHLELIEKHEYITMMKMMSPPLPPPLPPPPSSTQIVEGQSTTKTVNHSMPHFIRLSTESSRKIPTSESKKDETPNILAAFNRIKAATWLNLTTMLKDHPYIVTKADRRKTDYGDRVMVELNNNQSRLYLPERFNSMTDRHLCELGCGKYVLVNLGANGQSFRLGLIEKDKFNAMMKSRLNAVFKTMAHSWLEDLLNC